MHSMPCQVQANVSRSLAAPCSRELGSTWLFLCLCTIVRRARPAVDCSQLVRRLEAEAGGRLPVPRSVVRAELDAALLAMGAPSFCTCSAPQPVCSQWACAIWTCAAWANDMQLKTA